MALTKQTARKSYTRGRGSGKISPQTDEMADSVQELTCLDCGDTKKKFAKPKWFRRQTQCGACYEKKQQQQEEENAKNNHEKHIDTASGQVTVDIAEEDPLNLAIDSLTSPGKFHALQSILSTTKTQQSLALPESQAMTMIVAATRASPSRSTPTKNAQPIRVSLKRFLKSRTSLTRVLKRRMSRLKVSRPEMDPSHQSLSSAASMTTQMMTPRAPALPLLS
jgi:hypothetical protein